MPSRHSRRTPKATREAILWAAERIFVEHGLAGASLSAIAKEAGVTKSLIHYHFDSKEALWQAIKEARFDDYAVQQLKVFEAHGPVRAFLTGSFSAYFHFLQQNPHFLRLMWWTQAEQERSDAQSDLDASESMRSLVERGIAFTRARQETGELRADLEARFMFAAFLSLLRHWFVARRDFRLLDRQEHDADIDERYLKTITAILLDGVMHWAERGGEWVATGNPASHGHQGNRSCALDTPNGAVIESRTLVWMVR